jgi:hypothetical protein
MNQIHANAAQRGVCGWRKLKEMQLKPIGFKLRCWLAWPLLNRISLTRS